MKARVASSGAAHPIVVRADGSMSDTNVLGGALQPCSQDPLTGYFRDGCCRTDPGDRGLHVVCARVTDAFLAFSKQRGNDLSTPRPEYGFAGLQPGDQWCLCATRWAEAFDAGMAPDVVLEATHLNALGVVTLDALRAPAIDRERPARE